MLNGMADSGDAKLYYEVRGTGPALVMIPGAGGDAGFFEHAAEALADSFCVITYDRRGNSRSTGSRDSRMSMSEQASDVEALINEVADGRALVYGNSGGAIIGLALVSASPSVVTGLIAHEPPIVSLLPDGTEGRDLFTDVLAVMRERGLLAASAHFVGSVRGEGSYQWPPDLLDRFMANVPHLFKNEFAEFGDMRLDWDRLASSGVPIVMSAGREDRGMNYARPSVIIAERLGIPWTEFPGYHLPFLERPAEFVAALRAVATNLVSAGGSVPKPWVEP
jgi:pimeloyl-ACP methyl ester carboxylesterase